MELSDFKQLIFAYYAANMRPFPWRETEDPYAIAVSEIMLQQTQTERVVPKYLAFLAILPDWKALSTVSTQELFELWQGLGYNRRALALKRMAEVVVREHGGILPRDRETLETLPGIGSYTAGAIMAFAYNEPLVFIETNIRRVIIHHFFADAVEVSDAELIPYLAASIDQDNPREWYYALMDYGAYLGRTIPNPNRKSKQYMKQGAFVGSNRQVRGALLRYITANGRTPRAILNLKLAFDPHRIERSLGQLIEEGFLQDEGDSIVLR